MPEPTTTGATDLDATAVWVGAAAWLEEQLFELLGGWVTETPEPAVQVLLAAQSHHHAWHTELLRGLVPVRADLPAEPYVVPTPGAAALVDVLSAATGREATVERLATLTRVVLPRLHAAWASRLAVASPAADGPLVRALTLIARDDRDDLLAGERLLQALLVTPAEVDRAGAATGTAERVLVVAGGLLP